MIEQAESLSVSPTLYINNVVNEYKRNNPEHIVADFGLGEAPFGVANCVRRELEANSYRTSYVSPEGILELRRAVSRYYKEHFGLEIHPDQIVTGPGSKMLIYNIMTVLKSTWLLPVPSWVSYKNQLDVIGRKRISLHLPEDQNFCITKQNIENAINSVEGVWDEDDLIMLLNYPNNPCGNSIRTLEVQRIAKFAQNNEIKILSDEIYGALTHPTFGEKHHSFALEYPEGTIVSGGASKDRSMGGWRFGVVVLPEIAENFRKKLVAQASETYSCVPDPIQNAVITAYEASEEVQSQILDSVQIYSLIGQWVYKKLRQANYSLSEPEGAFYFMPSLVHKKEELIQKGLKTSDEIAKSLLNSYGIATLPGTAFGISSEEPILRISYVDFDGRAMLNAFRNGESQGNEEAFIRQYAPRIVAGVGKLIDFTLENTSS